MKDKKLPFVSVIVPTYNDEDTIKATISSLIRQTYPAKEIIVVYDKGSTDNTLQILSRVSKDYSQLVRVVSTHHVGRSAARNLGWKRSSGEILFFADADDIYNDDYLDKAVKCFLSNPQFGGVTLTGTYLKLESTFITECIDAYGKIQRKLFDERKIIPNWAWVYSRKAVEAVGGFDERLDQAEDKDLYLRVKKAGYSFGLVAGINWYHTRRGDLQDYLKKCYLGGKRRILYLLKHRKIAELSKDVISFWILCGVLFTSIIYRELLYIILLGAFVLLTYKLIVTLTRGWNCVQKKRYLFLLPVFGVITYLATAIGYSYGITLVCFEKLTGQKVNQ